MIQVARDLVVGEGPPAAGISIQEPTAWSSGASNRSTFARVGMNLLSLLKVAVVASSIGTPIWCRAPRKISRNRCLDMGLATLNGLPS